MNTSVDILQNISSKTARLFLVVLLAGIFNFALGQGTGADGNIVAGTGTTNTDGVKTNLSSTASAGNSSLTLAGTAGIFTVGQKIIIIQMAGTGIGTYEEATVTSIPNGNILILAAGLVNTYTVSAGNVVMLMKIMQYNNVTLGSGDKLTTSAWNGSTGGCMYIYVKGTLTINNTGRIDVSGLGFSGGSGGAGGAGGAGGSAGAASSGIAGNGLGGVGGTGNVNGGNGASIGSAGSVGNTGSIGAGPMPCNNTSVWSNSMQMGGGGTGGNGGTGGMGAGGGGGGGNGNGLGAGTGAAGTAGGIGGAGGTGGNGGTGGGIIRIYANTITGSASGYCVFANGSAGTTGVNGATGGAGGSGGAGGNSAFLGTNGGGGGGGGTAAQGGNGGNGGNGGAAGTVWFSYASTTFASTPVQVIAGTAGSGGSGGAAGTAGAGGSGGSAGTLGSVGVAGGTSPGTSGSNGTTATVSGVGSLLFAILNPLPIQLLSFDGACNHSEIKLNWNTATETNNALFAILKTNTGNDWQTLVTLPGAGTADEEHSYTTIDTNPHEGINYYQLKQTDYDGTSTLSQVIAVNFNAITDLTVSPNPSVNKTYVTFTLPTDEAVTVSVTNMQGTALFTNQFTCSQGINKLPIELSQYSAGLYIITITDNLGYLNSDKKLIKN